MARQLGTSAGIRPVHNYVHRSSHEQILPLDAVVICLLEGRTFFSVCVRAWVRARTRARERALVSIYKGNTLNELPKKNLRKMMIAFVTFIDYNPVFITGFLVAGFGVHSQLDVYSKDHD